MFMATKYTPFGESINYDSSHLANLGYTGHSNSEFDAWYNSLNEYEKEYVNNPSPVLLQFINAYKTADDYHKQQLDGAFRKYMSQEFSPTLMQQMGELFGDNAARQNFANVNNATFSTDISGILEAKHTEDYTDPVQDVARRKAAGINDDLSGGNHIGSGTPGSIDEQNIPSGIVNDGSSSLPEIGTSVAEVVSLSMNIAQGIQSLNAGEIGLSMSSLDLFNKSNQTLLDSLGNALTESDLRILLDPWAVDKDKKRLYDDDMRISAEAHLQQALSMLGSDPRLPRSLRSKLKKSWTPGVGSIKSNTEFYNLLSDVYSKKRNAVGLAGDPFNKGGFEECLSLIGEHVQQTVYDVQKLSAKFETDRLSVTGEDDKSLGTLAGESDVAAYSAEAYQKEYDAIVNKMWDSIMHDLVYGPNKDKWWSHLLRFSIPIVRLWLGNIKMPSVSHSTSTGIGANGHPVQNSSTSFGF